MYKCPECNEEFDSINYRENGSQYYSAWGRFDGEWNEDDFESGDRYDDSETTYECPECGHETNNYDEFETDEESENIVSPKNPYRPDNQFIKNTIL